ncbi:hypothetical protein F1880_008473 [Penicillium rolfsii]|nr:hypothetical protein F1880_008473 [Penicillium rolfsii]
MSNEQIAVQVIYPASSASSFDMSYYLKTHIPLVKKQWGPEGLQSWSVYAGREGADYHAQAVLIWKSLEAYNNRTAEEIAADIRNFTDVPPYRWVGKVIHQGTNAIQSNLSSEKLD